MCNAFLTDILREIRRRFGRFLLLVIISALGTAFYVGVKAASKDMRLTAAAYYSEQNLFDLHLQGYFAEAPEIDGADRVWATYSADAYAEAQESQIIVRTHALPGDGDTQMNTAVLKEGRWPEAPDEAVCEGTLLRRAGVELGGYVELTDDNGALDSGRFKLVGVVQSPMYISYSRGVSLLGDGSIAAYMLIPPEAYAYPVYTDVYLTLEEASGLDPFGTEYEEAVERAAAEIKAENPDWYVQGRSLSYGDFERDTERLEAIGDVFPLIFYLVAALVALTSMTRMIEEQRTLIGLYKALGYSRSAVSFKYLLYALTAGSIGSVAGFSFGQVFFPNVIWNAYTALYMMKPLHTPHHALLAGAACAVSIGALLLVAFLVCRGELRQRPAALMRPKPPAKGQRVLLERVGFVWKHLNFSYKMTARNLFRYKKRLFMTIVGIMGCTALLMTGYGLRDSIGGVGTRQFEQLYHYGIQLYVAGSSEDAVLEAYEEGLRDKLREPLFFATGHITLETGGQEDATLNVPKEPERMAEYFTLRNRRTGESFELLRDGVLLTEKLAENLGVSAGDTVTATVSDGAQAALTVEGVCENYVGDNCYMSPELYESLFGTPVYNSLTAAYDESTDAPANEINAMPFVLGMSLTRDVVDNLNDIVDVLDIVVAVLTMSAMALAVVVLTSLISISISERTRELATLKVLGFSSSELAFYLYRENAVLTLLGVLAGLPLGTLLHRYIIETVEVDLIMFLRYISPLSYFISALLTFVFAALINALMSIRLRRISMVESLKSVE